MNVLAPTNQPLTDEELAKVKEQLSRLPMRVLLNPKTRDEKLALSLYRLVVTIDYLKEKKDG